MPPKAPMNTTTATMEPAQRAGREFCLGATLRPAHGPDGLRPQGREQAANQRRLYKPQESKFLSLIALAVLTLCSIQASAQEPSREIKEEAFEPLFDGKSFSGWRVNEQTPTSWKIENGLLVLTGGSSHLFTTEPFDDFIVRFEWRPAKKGYNSGFFVRGRQIQMAQGGAGKLFHVESAKAVPELHKPPGEWNEWEVTCVGTTLSLRVNGKPAWEIKDFQPKTGSLGFEAEGHAIDFRNLRIKRVGKPQQH